MRLRHSLFLAVLAVFLALPACSPVTSSPADLGADTVKTSETTAAPTVSTLPARIKSGVQWLWASYATMKQKGFVTPSMDDLRETILDIEAVASRGDLVAALDLWNKARALVTQIVAVSSK